MLSHVRFILGFLVLVIVNFPLVVSAPVRGEMESMEVQPTECPPEDNNQTTTTPEPSTAPSNPNSTTPTTAPSANSTSGGTTTVPTGEFDNETEQCPWAWASEIWQPNTMKTYVRSEVTYTMNECSPVHTTRTAKVCRKTFDRTVFRYVQKCRKVTKFISTTHCTQVTKKRVVRSQTNLQRIHPEHGFISPVPDYDVNYLNNVEVVWQFQAPEGHLVYLQIEGVDLHTGGEACGADKITVYNDACSAPLETICNNSKTEFIWATGTGRRMQIKFVADSTGVAEGFKAAYYYYPFNSSIDPLAEATRRLKELKDNKTEIENIRDLLDTSNQKRKRRQQKQSQSKVTGEEVSSDQPETVYKADETSLPPLTSRRLYCIDDILHTNDASKYLHDQECDILAEVFLVDGYYSPY